MRLHFEETQRMRTPWVLAIVLMIAGAAWWAFVQQIILGEAFGDHPGSDGFVWGIMALGGIGLPLLMWFMSLHTTVDDRELIAHWRPLRRRRIARADITSARAVTYRPIRDYGGWGIRRGWKRWCYTMSGDEGVLVETRDGKQLLIGSKRAGDLERALNGR